MKRRVLLYGLLAAAWWASPAVTALSQAHQSWEKTSYLNWSGDEVKAVLESSPWSRVVERASPIAPSTFGIKDPGGTEKFKVLLRSALPVRQALLRERQLASGYGNMSAGDRAAFDVKNKALLDCPACAKYYVVSITCFHSCFSGRFVEDYKKTFYLTNERGERRELAGATAITEKNGGGMVFFFPRLNDKGEPLLTPQNKELTVHFAVQALVNLNVVNEKYKFDVKKIVRGGEVVF